ncbi:hypothetical protein GOQ27_03115 [Clostridium sp. D2Q-11]|uniref:Uncharacterized protein n=1 Tax=Anaeromonas frigoriresistens TaxID=2683708 RepID=A0A942UT20_9FIRM|nr:hypothetical protein [Anaeromonas frigoriresistens]MBS4537435.1 hypothetical protein [Anaeromonas frigoriresistens]
MGNLEEDVIKILATSTFQKIANNDVIKIAQLNATVSLLIKKGIPFDIEFSPGTRRIATQAILTIYIKPTTQLTFIISFDEGGTGADI